MSEALPPPAAISAFDAAVTGPKLGAAAPKQGDFVFTMGAGLALLIPQATIEGRIGLGGDTSAELRYRNLGVLGHLGQARFTWAIPVSSRLTVGLAARTQIGSIGSGIEAKTGIDLTSLSLGNDWEVGHDIIVTWTRPHFAHVTWSIGPTYALAGPRYYNYDESPFEWDARLQSVSASGLGEWELSAHRRFFIKLDALFLVKADVIPFGFLPTITIGHAWST